MTYHPFSVPMLSDILEISTIIVVYNRAQFKRITGNGQKWGVSLTYNVQDVPNGLTEAFITAELVFDGHPSAMTLEDNIFNGDGLTDVLISASERDEAGTVFVYRVSDPKRYGVSMIKNMR